MTMEKYLVEWGEVIIFVGNYYTMRKFLKATFIGYIILWVFDSLND